LSRRQHVIPEPQPISGGNMPHGMPERSTNRIPVSAARSETLGRPNVDVGFGSIGSIRAHNLSSISGFAISPLMRKQSQR
jgi:hypothetical protein